MLERSISGAHTSMDTFFIRLRSFRKRMGLSQEDLAFLLGLKLPSAISRHEAGEREPDLATALGYEIIHRLPGPALWPQLFAEVRRKVRERACQLAETLRQGIQDSKTVYKLQQLAHLLDADGDDAPTV
jgi:transcriptional regulator with XRE-family HTH domain